MQLSFRAGWQSRAGNGLRAGSMADPVAKPGVAAMTIRTIDMGTPTRKALEIENALGDLGTALSGSTGRESVTLNFEVLSRNLGPAFGVLADVPTGYPLLLSSRELSRPPSRQRRSSAGERSGRLRARKSTP